MREPWGTLAMFAAAFISGILVLRFFGRLNTGRAVVAALLGATVGAVTELFSPGEWDTVTVPVVIMIALMLLRQLEGKCYETGG